MNNMVPYVYLKASFLKDGDYIKWHAFFNVTVM